MLSVGVVGYGYWGPNLVRNFSETPGARVGAVCDTRPQVLEQVRQRFPLVKTTTDYAEMLADPQLDAIVIATPVSTHHALAMDALRAGKHVLVSKPLARSSTEAREIVEEAERRGLVLLVDHTFAYMGAVSKVRELVEAGELGDLYYFDSVRVNLGLYQHDVNVMWDLAVHDLSIAQAWIPQRPHAVSCVSVGHVEGHPEDIAYLTLFYENNLVAHVHVNWLSPVKVRRTLLGGSRKMVLFDDLDPVEKIKVYDRGVTHREDLVGSGLVPLAYRRQGDVWSPQVDLTEALRVEAEHFVRCVTEGETPRTGGRTALELVEILEAAELSAREQGRVVRLAEAMEGVAA
jgi:predicted dehydrogenase